MDSFLDLFNPSWENESPVEDFNGNLIFENEAGYSSKNTFENLNSTSASTNLPDYLPSEPQEGNIEYKLKLLNPNNERFKRLVSQV